MSVEDRVGPSPWCTPCRKKLPIWSGLLWLRPTTNNTRHTKEKELLWVLQWMTMMMIVWCWWCGKRIWTADVVLNAELSLSLSFIVPACLSLKKVQCDPYGMEMATEGESSGGGSPAEYCIKKAFKLCRNGGEQRSKHIPSSTSAVHTPKKTSHTYHICLYYSYVCIFSLRSPII